MILCILLRRWWPESEQNEWSKLRVKWMEIPDREMTRHKVLSAYHCCSEELVWNFQGTTLPWLYPSWLESLLFPAIGDSFVYVILLQTHPCYTFSFSFFKLVVANSRAKKKNFANAKETYISCVHICGHFNIWWKCENKQLSAFPINFFRNIHMFRSSA